ncbi:MAG: phytanoyl-CoA dioxygenase family protein [Myxococcota bacterium]|nr:phytanoyl-CoA dioxygenase family protein [Myxococcota bacterium]
MELSQEALGLFRRDGFVNAGKVFEQDELAQIAGEYDRLVRKENQVLGNEEDGVFPYRAMLNFRSPALQAVILHPGLVAVAREILGDEIRFWWDQGINKSPGAGSRIPWHQDNGYHQGRTQEFLTCWLALDDSSLENGGLEAIPGSHKAGHREHGWEGVHAAIPPQSIEDEGAIPLDVKAGELLIFSSLLVHQTGGNTTEDRQRRSWVIQYCRGDQRNEITGEVYDNRPWVMRDGELATTLVAERPFDLKRKHA